MKIVMSLVLAALGLSACTTSDRPSVAMIAEINALTLSTADTLVVSRALINNGGNDVWLNVSAPAYDMRDAEGQSACHVVVAPAVTVVELVRIQPDSTLLDVREYPLEGRENCTPGVYTITIVSVFQTRQEGGETITLRTSPTQMTITAPPVAAAAAAAAVGAAARTSRDDG